MFSSPLILYTTIYDCSTYTAIYRYLNTYPRDACIAIEFDYPYNYPSYRSGFDHLLIPKLPATATVIMQAACGI